ncbi:uncharacterized protein FA14DRAFT_159982 [Meira miltonrushii]|uniref:Uncharacterized protein n=1 Tax=Meira miltonrushii TaxID=1280837 RepID=A0A316VSB4_9BASI|nr:uncharacterized protein FA14DRAFT_159982 [Meira miltonrushii]PWN38395.1 hypothetical protein FA14DRAFT_159982 [Meira miltonrushii]
MAPKTRSQSKLKAGSQSALTAIKDKQLNGIPRIHLQRDAKAISAMEQQHLSYHTDQASSSSSKSVIGEDVVVMQSRHVAMALPTSPESMSPSSLFDYGDEEEEESFDNNVRGWLSQTSKHLQSSEIPSSRSPKKKMQVISPWNAQIGDLEEDEEAQEFMPTSPTLQIGSRKNDIRRVKSLPNWQGAGKSRSDFGTRQLSRTSSSKDAIRSKTTPIQTDQNGSRPATPSSSVRRREAMGLPERPQSAMKHKSANEYSSGKNVPTITISSGSLPQSQDDEEEETIFKSTTLSRTNNSFSNRIRGVTSMRKEQLKKEAGTRQISSPIRSDSDGFSPSPIKKSNSFPALKRKPYVLHSRQSLPNNDFYQRTKQEERSPTPAKRIKTFPQFE